MHGDIYKYPVVSLLLKFRGKMHRVKVSPLILGTNWEGFHRLLGQYAGMQLRPVDLCDVCEALSGDAGSTDSGGGGGGGNLYRGHCLPLCTPRKIFH